MLVDNCPKCHDGSLMSASKFLGLGCLSALCVSAILTSSSAGLFSVSQAQANGRFPATTNVVFQPGDENRLLLPTTFGLLISEDKGENFRWVCEQTIGYGGTYDPDYAIADDGAIYATTFNGVQVSRDSACTFQDTEFFGDLTGGNNPEVLAPGYFVSEIEVASDGKIWAATSSGDNTNNIYISTDGNRFVATNAFQEVAWWKSLRVSKSNTLVAYAAGYEIGIPIGTPARALLFKTIDGGQTWTDLGVSDFSFGTQPNLFIEGISPTDPNIVYARVLAARSPEGDDLYRSIDGGQSFTKVLEMFGVISAFLIRDDGSLIAGMSTPCEEDFSEEPDASMPFKGCVRTSPTGALGTWVKPAVEPKMGCIGERDFDNQLYGCGHNWDPDNFGLGTSDDNGDSWTKVMRFGEIAGPLQCPDGTPQHTCEIENWPAVCVQLGICEREDADAGGAAADDAGMGADAGPGNDDDKGDSCLGCQSGNSGGIPFLLFVLAVYGLGFRRKSRQKN